MMKHATWIPPRDAITVFRFLFLLAKFQNKRHTLIRVRTGILSGVPGSSVRRPLSARLFRGSGLHGSFNPLQPGGGCDVPPTVVKDQSVPPLGETPHIIPHPRRRCKRKIHQEQGDGDTATPWGRPERRRGFRYRITSKSHTV